MDFLASLLINEYLWWIVAILITVFTVWVTFQSIALGVPINRFTQFLWIVTILAWLIIFARNLVEYVIGNTQSQVILFILVVAYLIFAPVKDKGGKKK